MPITKLFFSLNVVYLSLERLLMTKNTFDRNNSPQVRGKKEYRSALCSGIKKTEEVAPILVLVGKCQRAEGHS